MLYVLEYPQHSNIKTINKETTMTDKKKAKLVILKIRDREQEMFDQRRFCGEHNFLLEEAKFKAIEEELRQICILLQDEFQTGDVFLPGF
jgi:hypothetical protein